MTAGAALCAGRVLGEEQDSHESCLHYPHQLPGKVLGWYQVPWNSV